MSEREVIGYREIIGYHKLLFLPPSEPLQSDLMMNHLILSTTGDPMGG